jgi:acyl-CoA thioesterase
MEGEEVSEDILKVVFEKINPSTLRHKWRGLLLGLSPGRRLRVDPERRFRSTPSKAGLGAVEWVNAEDSFARQIGVRLIEFRPGFARACLSVTEATLNIYQMAHGGAMFSVADQACEAAGNSYGEPAVALQNNLHFLTAGRSGDILEATAKLTNRSSRVGLIEFEVRNHEGHLLAIGQQLIYFKRTRE